MAGRSWCFQAPRAPLDTDVVKKITSLPANRLLSNAGGQTRRMPKQCYRTTHAYKASRMNPLGSRKKRKYRVVKLACMGPDVTCALYDHDAVNVPHG